MIKLRAAQNPEDWLERKTFTTDWFSYNIPHWKKILKRFEGKQIEILEIGSYEGRSSVFLLEHLNKSNITCIDPFFNTAEDAFDRNTKEYEGRVTKVKSQAMPVLHRFAEEKKSFDLIYIDGDHRRQPTFSHSVLCWPLLKVGGILIWDDWKWDTHLPSADRPEHAIDLFCDAFGSCMRILHRRYQVAAEKTAEWPESNGGIRGWLRPGFRIGGKRQQPGDEG